MHARRAFLLALALAIPLVVHAGASAVPPAPYVVVVNASNPATSVGRKFLADAFLKKTTRWDFGEAIRPVDQAPDSPARRRFSEEVVKRSVAAVRNYWQQVIFSGRDVPPPELGSDEEVVKYVLKYPGAIGYVAGGADVRDVKTIVIE
jgi:ABC-type phosphate transport system substrate-binding protein